MAAATIGLVLAAGAALGGCTQVVDQEHAARTARTALGALDQVAAAEVTTASWDHGASISLTYADIDEAKGLSGLIAQVAEVAQDQGIGSYVLRLTPEDGDGEQLAVDETFAGSSGERAVLDHWFRVNDALLGTVQYDVERGCEAITVDAGGAIAHDVEAAGRDGYGDPDTTWTFRSGDSSFVATGPVTASDVRLLEDVQREVGSAGLPVAAERWQLFRRFGHVRLDLDVDLGKGAVSPADLTVASYGTAMTGLATAALGRLDETGLPRFLSLRHTSGDSAPVDVFGTWTSTQSAAPGRDRLDRGWDAWLAKRA